MKITSQELQVNFLSESSQWLALHENHYMKANICRAWHIKYLLLAWLWHFQNKFYKILQATTLTSYSRTCQTITDVFFFLGPCLKSYYLNLEENLANSLAQMVVLDIFPRLLDNGLHWALSCLSLATYSQACFTESFRAWSPNLTEFCPIISNVTDWTSTAVRPSQMYCVNPEVRKLSQLFWNRQYIP